MNEEMIALLKSIDERLRDMNETLRAIDEGTTQQNVSSQSTLDTVGDIQQTIVKWAYKLENPDADINI